MWSAMDKAKNALTVTLDTLEKNAGNIYLRWLRLEPSQQQPQPSLPGRLGADSSVSLMPLLMVQEALGAPSSEAEWEPSGSDQTRFSRVRSTPRSEHNDLVAPLYRLVTAVLNGVVELPVTLSSFRNS